MNNEDITSTSTFGGNNECIRNSGDDGEVKSTPALLSGYCGVDEGEDCKLARLGVPMKFHETAVALLDGEAGGTAEDFLCFERTVTDTTRGDRLMSSALTSTS